MSAGFFGDLPDYKIIEVYIIESEYFLYIHHLEDTVSLHVIDAVEVVNNVFCSTDDGKKYSDIH